MSTGPTTGPGDGPTHQTGGERGGEPGAPWHADDDDLAAYAAGRAPAVLAMSLESHLVRCAGCRGRLGTLAGAEQRDRAWERLAARIDRPRRRSLLGHGLLRTAVATPVLLRAALAALLLVGLVPVVTAAVAGSAGLALLLVAAPLGPVAAVALAYRDQADPAGEIGLATPAAGLRLVAARALLVAAVALPVAFAALLVLDTWFADVPVALSFAWCLPGLALAAVVMLAGTTRVDPALVAGVAAVAWTVVVATVELARRDTGALVDVMAHDGTQLGALAVVVAAGAATVLRRDAVSYRGAA